MACGVRFYAHAVYEVDGVVKEVGSLMLPSQIAIAGEKVEKTLTIEASTTAKVFDIDLDGIGDFDFLWMQCDYDLHVEFVVDDDADVGEVVFTLPLKGTSRANELGPPLVLCKDDSYANYTVNFAAGTLDVIETIRVQNLDASNGSQLYLLALT